MRRTNKSLALIVFLPRASFELGRARFALKDLTPRDIIALNALPASGRVTRNMRSARETTDEIARVLPTIAKRLPWRADCLVQALAGQRWLRSRGISSKIRIGVDRASGGELDAHAWLESDGKIVLGGKISRFVPILGSKNDEIRPN